jgi:hypothetical protein
MLVRKVLIVPRKFPKILEKVLWNFIKNLEYLLEQFLLPLLAHHLPDSTVLLTVDPLAFSENVRAFDALVAKTNPHFEMSSDPLLDVK